MPIGLATGLLNAGFWNINFCPGGGGVIKPQPAQAGLMVLWVVKAYWVVDFCVTAWTGACWIFWNCCCGGAGGDGLDGVVSIWFGFFRYLEASGEIGPSAGEPSRAKT